MQPPGAVDGDVGNILFVLQTYSQKWRQFCEVGGIALPAPFDMRQKLLLGKEGDDLLSRKNH
ncbi:hypothetical protein [Paenibacillus odorifer]|uniref:hypothetical protein n=1 Tax=Paenibacillus odorifer TaxID=189426 RepID=UPI003D0C3C4E